MSLTSDSLLPRTQPTSPSPSPVPSRSSQPSSQPVSPAPRILAPVLRALTPSPAPASSGGPAPAKNRKAESGKAPAFGVSPHFLWILVLAVILAYIVFSHVSLHDLSRLCTINELPLCVQCH